jgi:hypothetical protein
MNNTHRLIRIMELTREDTVLEHKPSSAVPAGDIGIFVKVPFQNGRLRRRHVDQGSILVGDYIPSASQAKAATYDIRDSHCLKNTLTRSSLPTPS